MSQCIATNIQQVHHRMTAACHAAGRDVQSITLLAVTKTQPDRVVREAVAAGLRHFGENYVQEGVAKIQALADLRSHLEWHFIGPLQRNKTRPVAEQFDWVHSLDRWAVAERLNAQRPSHLPPLQVCLQVNVSGEARKQGCAPEAVLALAQSVQTLPRLRLRGLMSIPHPTHDPRLQHQAHRQLYELAQTLRRHGCALDTLSMGMTADLEAAIAQGATVVRVGTALFGARPSAPASEALGAIDHAD